ARDCGLVMGSNGGGGRGRPIDGGRQHIAAAVVPLPHRRSEMALALLAAIFDVDGVLVGSPHEHPWREALTGFAEPAGFPPGVYQAYVAGRPRLEGARAALEGLGGVGAVAHAAEYAAVKQTLIDKLIEEGSFDAFPDAVRFAAALHAAGLKLALA